MREIPWRRPNRSDRNKALRNRMTCDMAGVSYSNRKARKHCAYLGYPVEAEWFRRLRKR